MGRDIRKRDIRNRGIRNRGMRNRGIMSFTSLLLRLGISLRNSSLKQKK
jgi:hypothetical protein